MSDLHIILTGGTIEKTYNPLTERTEFNESSVLSEYLQSVIKSYPNLSFDSVARIDSLNMTDEIRDSIVQAVHRTSSKNVVIVHGTSTMENTAEYVANKLGETDKTVILTGAMIPLKEFAMSDGGFNIGYAMAAAQSAEAGVYLAMNACLFKAGEATKNTASGRFEAA